MTTKETLTELFNEANRFPFEKPKYDTYDLLQMYKQIQNNLEILEILKYRIHLKDSVIKNDMKEYEVCFIEASGFVFKNSEEYKLLKGWLKDE